MKPKSAFFVFTIIALIVLVYASAYTVDETNQVVVTQFGRLVGKPVITPGLKWKVPFIQKTNFFQENMI